MTTDLAPPGFHHLHLNSMDPDAAIDFYTRRFPSTSRTTWCDQPALSSPNNVLILFDKVDAPPATSPQTAIWHFGWHVTDTQGKKETYVTDPEVTLLPLYTGVGGSVFASSDTWPGSGGLLGLTREQIEEAKVAGVQPTGTGGFGYIQGPDAAIVEYSGNRPKERFNHVHFYQEQPFCSQMWYQVHLNANLFEGRNKDLVLTEDTCACARGSELSFPALEPDGMYRSPASAVEFGDVAFLWYMRQGEAPLESTRGHVYDHLGLNVPALDPWIAKLRGEKVRFLSDVYKLGDTRAVMIEGPSREVIELIEA